MSPNVAGPLGRLPPLPTIKEIVKMYNVFSRKSLSQNFLLEPKLVSKFVSCARPIKNKVILEVGPGPGTITRSILQQYPKYVIGIEKDTRFRPALKLLQDASNGRLIVGLRDILSVDLNNVFPQELKTKWEENPPDIHIMGNLPFNISLPLTVKWLQSISEHSCAWSYGRVPMTLTFQHEVAVRMAADAGHPERCRLSVMCQNWCDVDYNFSIPGRAFHPAPKVDVGVVTMVPRVEPGAEVEFRVFERLLRVMFSAKNKYCRTPLMNLFPMHRREELVQKMLTVADVDPTVATDRLENDDFYRLAYIYESILKENRDLAKYEHTKDEAEQSARKIIR